MGRGNITNLSRFERRLHGWLWFAAVVSCVGAFTQHVVLRDTPEVFHHGADLGELLYDLAIAYISAFIFYLLVVRLPLQRDRRNMYQYLAPSLRRVYGEAVSMMWNLNGLADVDSKRDNTRANIEATCEALAPTTAANMLIRGSDGTIRKATALELLGHHINRAHEVNDTIMKFANYLDSASVRNIAEIEDCAFFNFFRFTEGQMGNATLSVFGPLIYEYLRLVDRHAEYCREIGLGVASPSNSLPPENDAVPLKREMNNL
jgi:hypothetical protein